MTATIKCHLALEGNCYKTFRTQTRHSYLKGGEFWEPLNSNVLGILENYFDYIERLRKEGVARKAIYFERRDRLRR
jgi:hypothetical protein